MAEDMLLKDLFRVKGMSVTSWGAVSNYVPFFMFRHIAPFFPVLAKWKRISNTYVSF